jgi:hypothetical protein
MVRASTGAGEYIPPRVPDDIMAIDVARRVSVILMKTLLDT